MNHMSDREIQVVRQLLEGLRPLHLDISVDYPYLTVYPAGRDRFTMAVATLDVNSYHYEVYMKVISMNRDERIKLIEQFENIKQNGAKQ